MTKLDKILFSRCPLCREGTISIETRRRLLFSRSNISPCPICSAVFVSRGDDNYQLWLCNPHKLIGRHDCREHVFRGCYLGATLAKSEWKKIAAGHESDAFQGFLEMSARFQRGLLPTYPSEGLPLALDEDEVVHYVSYPVHLDEKQPSLGSPVDKGSFVLTNKRIVFVREAGKLSISLDNIRRVEEAPPGFMIQEKDSFEPFYFFPPRYDPIFAAVKGAINNLGRT